MAISIKLKTPSKRCQGFWKLNNSILSEHEYCTKVKNIIDECSHLHIDSKQIIWEVLKWEVKQMSIEYSKKKSRERQTLLHLLETELNNLLTKDSDTETDKVRIIQVENDIKEIYNFKANGAFVRSRLQFMEEGERNSKFILSQEKSRQNRNNITSLNVDGKHFNNSVEILNQEAIFYESLYKSNACTNSDLEFYLNSITIEKTVTENDANLCEDHISLQELSNALASMKHNKSPGLDGLTVEFYQKFWDILSPLLLNCFTECTQKGELTHTQKQCIFVLLH